MKPEIPETGVVITTENETARIFLKGGEHCRNCGAGKIGLCRPAGDTVFLSVANTIGASAGDIVKIGLERSVQTKGLVLAFIIPLASFVTGAFTGVLLGKIFPVAAIEVIAGFFAFLLGSWYSMTKLRKMNSAYRMAIQAIISDKGFSEVILTDEERRYNLLSHGPGQVC